jgi:hypothetical protein
MIEEKKEFDVISVISSYLHKQFSRENDDDGNDSSTKNNEK